MADTGLVKMGKKIKLTMEGQCHIYTIDLIFLESACHTKGSYVQWMVFCIIYMPRPASQTLTFKRAIIHIKKIYP